MASHIHTYPLNENMSSGAMLFVDIWIIFRPKYAVAAVKKKLYSQNPHQAMFALLTLESIVKNCGKFKNKLVHNKNFCFLCMRDNST